MVIFLYGTDGYRLSQNKDTVIASYKAKHSSGLNLRVINGSDLNASDMLADAIKSTSFFKEVKLIVLKDCFKGSADKLLGVLKDTDISSDKDCVVLATHTGTEAEAKPKELFTFLSAKTNLVRNFKPLEGAQLTAWLKKEALARGTPFEPAALRAFTERVGEDSWQAINGLEKLSNFSRGPITLSAVDLLIRLEGESNIFSFIDALGTRNNLKATDLMFKEISYGRDPYYILTMIAYQFRNMLIVRDLLDKGKPTAVIAKEAGLHPFATRKIVSAASKFTPQELRLMYKRILELELGSKSGAADLEDSLYAFVLAA